jgi:regulatory protein
MNEVSELHEPIAGSDPAADEVPTARMLAWARNSAAYRLGRRMHTEKELGDAISRKARQKFEGIDELQVAALVEAAVRFGYDNLALDDVSYAEIASRSGVTGGRSKRAIAQRLTRKGIARETAAAAVADVDDFRSALIFARKRAFGPFRRVELDDKRRLKEFAAFARAGFAFDVGRMACDIGLEEAEDILADSRRL